ncbi:hypothetical protein RFI_16508 [Reticulomyxa filosa]|uniref:Uncharacterized protein n=1 Tax=Reticulomyxa filosa TaxID=46433 RepID=X6N5W3_RETFI|nr:hypothetical protein RFI_16508 [Reticulomyxa filosa]|eukprot:ETO20707.1 hypothetical protein RFI_16508 [Reticulomyxa filosa]
MTEYLRIIQQGHLTSMYPWQFQNGNAVNDGAFIRFDSTSNCFMSLHKYSLKQQRQMFLDHVRAQLHVHCVDKAHKALEALWLSCLPGQAGVFFNFDCIQTFLWKWMRCDPHFCLHLHVLQAASSLYATFIHLYIKDVQTVNYLDKTFL